jgi:hypothetical protein
MFDIGIYFEANGHGTVLYSHSLLQRLRKVCVCVCMRHLAVGQPPAVPDLQRVRDVWQAASQVGLC